MQVQDDIVLTVLQAKDYAGCLGQKYIDMEADGNDVSKCCYFRLMLLMRWICILENYYCTNFNANGNIVDPDTSYLTLEQALNLLSKVKAFIKKAS